MITITICESKGVKVKISDLFAWDVKYTSNKIYFSEQILTEIDDQTTYSDIMEELGSWWHKC